MSDTRVTMRYTRAMTTSSLGLQASFQGQPKAQRQATVAEWLSQPEEKGAELIGGRIEYKALPTLENRVMVVLVHPLALRTNT